MPGHEIEIRAAAVVEQTHALAALEDHRVAPVGLQHVLGFERS